MADGFATIHLGRGSAHNTHHGMAQCSHGGVQSCGVLAHFDGALPGLLSFDRNLGGTRGHLVGSRGCFGDTAGNFGGCRTLFLDRCSD